MIKKNALIILGVLYLIIESSNFVMDKEGFERIFSSWTLCVYLFLACVYWLIYSVGSRNNFKQWIEYGSLIFLCISGQVLYGEFYDNKYFEIVKFSVLLVVVVTLFLFNKPIINESIELKLVSKLEIKEFFYEKFREKKINFDLKGLMLNAISIYLILIIAIIQGILSYINSMVFKFVLQGLFYVLLLGLSRKKYMLLERRNKRFVIDMFMVFIEFVFSILYDTANIDFYVLILQILLWLPYISSALNMNTYNEIKEHK